MCDDYTPHQTQISKQNQVSRLALVYIDCVREHSMDQYWPDKPAMDCLNVYTRVFITAGSVNTHSAREETAAPRNALLFQQALRAFPSHLGSV